jgi:hypothetical protein
MSTNDTIERAHESCNISLLRYHKYFKEAEGAKDTIKAWSFALCPVFPNDTVVTCAMNMYDNTETSND